MKKALLAVADKRPPDFVIGSPEQPYMRRWWLIQRNRWLNIYLHHIMRSDDDRAHHDHPWMNLSIILQGRYIEHTISADGVEHRVERPAGTWKFRMPSASHRLELARDQSFWDELSGCPISDDLETCWTLFITGPRVREWGFHCPKGWRNWRLFCAPHNPGEVGRGCE